MGRPFSSDLQTRPKNPRSLTPNDEVIILAYRWRTRLSLDDSLVRLRRLMPQLSPQKIDAVTTEICPAFVHVREAFGEYMRAVSPHPFAVLVGGWAPKLARIEGASPRSGCDGGGHRLDAEGVEGAAQIVGERRQAELGAHIGEAAHQAP
jgi:hypothetical protein